MIRYAVLQFFISAIFLLAPSAASAHFTGKGHAHSSMTKAQNFLNANCQKTDTCELKRFTIFTSEYELNFPDSSEPSYGTETIMEYETDSVASIENYALVNFIRGCSFDSVKDDEGEIVKSLSNLNKEQFGANKKIYFPEWVIDSIDEDPVYNSDQEFGRHYLLRWNVNQHSYNFTTKKYYGEEKPKKPIVYLTDLPGSAYKDYARIYNISLEFKTCIYRSKDVPLSTVETDVNFADPIKCFEWASSYIYNFDTQKFEHKNALDPFCTDQNAALARKEELR